MNNLKHTLSSLLLSFDKYGHQSALVHRVIWGGLVDRFLVIALLSLSILAFASSSIAAGRIFYDGFESENTSLWARHGNSNACQVVTSAADRVLGPYAGSRMVRCNSDGTVAWNSPAANETLVLSSLPYTNELFFRTWVRFDQNNDRTSSSPRKILRIFNWTGVRSEYNDIYEVFWTGASLRNEGVAGGTPFATYWGGASGDNTASTTSWHRVEYYFNKSTGTVKVWHDGVLVRNNTGFTFRSAWFPMEITSNWSDSHDSTNYVYFDEFEVYSDRATGATGLMSDATIRVSGGGMPPDPPLSPPNAPQNLLVQ